ncbi:MAG: hypothetical protein AW07_04082 [Candidatus Accumulibacter sp. SK-11]|nr:MAG: hypothetical protein AW07_04082 [Candidatus Accumulibacter sp. SK-11]
MARSPACRPPAVAALAGLARGAVGGRAEAGHRRPEVALGVDQEVGGDDHLLALADAGEDLDVVVAARSEADRARLEAAFGLPDQDDPAGAAVDHGGDRHARHRGPGGQRQFHLGKHRRLEQPARIGEFDARRHRARLGVQRRIDVGDDAFEVLAGMGIDRHPGLAAGADEADVPLEAVGDGPHR